MNKIRLILLVIVMTFFSGLAGQNLSGFALEKWELVKSKNDIEVYIHRKKNGFDRVRILAKIHVSLNEFIAYLNSAKHYTDWVYACNKSREVYNSTDTLIYETCTDMPFPFTDRILKVLSQKSRSPNSYETISKGIELENCPDHYVAIPYFSSRWHITIDKPGILNVFYEVESDPGGAIPSWLYDMAVDIGPYKTMQSLKGILESKKTGPELVVD